MTDVPALDQVVSFNSEALSPGTVVNSHEMSEACALGPLHCFVIALLPSADQLLTTTVYCDKIIRGARYDRVSS